MFDIKNQKLTGDGTKFKQSAHAGAKLLSVEAIVIMSTGGDTIDGAVNWAATAGSNFAPHLIVGTDGAIVQTVKLDEQGRFAPDGGEDTALAIAFVNPGQLRKLDDNNYVPMIGDRIFGPETKMLPDYDNTAWIPYTTAQIQTLLKLIAFFRTQYGVDFEVMRHDEFTESSLGPGLSLGHSPLITGFGPKKG